MPNDTRLLSKNALVITGSPVIGCGVPAPSTAVKNLVVAPALKLNAVKLVVALLVRLPVPLRVKSSFHTLP